MVKTLLVFCDGTGMDGTLTGLEPRSTSANHPTNVFRLSRAVPLRTKEGNLQLVFYQSGVASEANFASKNLWLAEAFDAGAGVAVASKIRDAYVFLAQNYEEKDVICLFGFSRGAYTARKVAALIDKLGILDRNELNNFAKYWDALTKNIDPQVSDSKDKWRKTATVAFMGLWDTVGTITDVTVSNPFKDGISKPLKTITDALNNKDTSIPVKVDAIYHALSMHENRKKILPILFEPEMPQQLKPEELTKNGRKVFQVWFPGAHSDVGGGYPNHQLADISLFWMVGGITNHTNIELDEDLLKGLMDKPPVQGSELPGFKLEPWGTYRPHDSFYETPALFKGIIGRQDRLDSKHINTSSVFHLSVAETFTSDDWTKIKTWWQRIWEREMLTTATIQNTLRESKSVYTILPNYACLNVWETKLKEKWDIDAPKLSASDRKAKSLDPNTPDYEVQFTPLVWASGFTEDFGEFNLEPVASVCRAKITDTDGKERPGLFPGTFFALSMTATVTYGETDVKEVESYQILHGEEGTFKWVNYKQSKGKIDDSSIKPVYGGYDGTLDAKGNPTSLYIAQTSRENQMYYGYVAAGSDIAYFPMGDKGTKRDEFDILVHRLTNEGTGILEIEPFQMKGGGHKVDVQNAQMKDTGRVIVGLNGVQVTDAGGYQVKIKAPDTITFRAFTTTMTVAHVSAGAGDVIGDLSYFATDNPDFRTGTFVGHQPENQSYRVDFYGDTFPHAPIVLATPMSFSVDPKTGCEVEVTVTLVDQGGFNFHFVDKGTAYPEIKWVAFLDELPYVAHGTFDMGDSPNRTISFPDGKFRKTPQVWIALNKWGWNTNKLLGQQRKIKFTASNISTTGMTWDDEQVGMQKASASWVAIDMPVPPPL